MGAAPQAKSAPVIKGLGGVSAPNARLAAFVGTNGVVLRSKGVASVDHFFEGQYCIVPKASLQLDSRRSCPCIGRIFRFSRRCNLAQYVSAGCVVNGRSGILVITARVVGALTVGDAAFTIIVP